MAKPNLSEQDFQRLQVSAVLFVPDHVILYIFIGVIVGVEESKLHFARREQSSQDRYVQVKHTTCSIISPISALATAQDRIGDLERDLDKVQKSVIKSKKATEVQMLIRDNESLQKQLRSQEDEYRQQNTALLTELSNVSQFDSGFNDMLTLNSIHFSWSI